MIFELNPFKWGKKSLPKITALSVNPQESHPSNIPAVQPAAPAEKPMANIFTTIMAWIVKEEKVVYADILKYAPPLAKLAELLFPSEAAAIAGGESAALDVTELVQNAVLMVEQKYAAAGVANGTGTQKSAEVIALAGGAVTSLLKQLGITATGDYLQNLVTAVVGVLNAQQITIPAATA